MTFKHFLLLASAATLPLSAVRADENTTYLEQLGPGNTAMVDQSGGDNNAAGYDGGAMRQEAGQPLSTNNTLKIVQSGDGNSVGLTPIPSRGTGVLQLSQKTNGSSADILQSSSNNVIGSINQVTRFGGTYASGNTLEVEQSGGDANIIGSISQDRDGGDNGSFADIDMLGAGNRIASISQATKGAGLGNSLEVVITGDTNGTLGLSGFAEGSMASDSTIIQGMRYSGDQGNNTASINISGNDNEFGVTQLGLDNDIGTLDIDGAGNQVGTYQNGTGNLITIQTLASNGNNIGVTQLMDDNEVAIDASGDDHQFGVYQDGEGNYADLTVSGTDNGLAASNPFGLSGDALSASNGSLHFEIGMVKQFGMDNIVEASFDGGSNLFGMVQDGDDNEIGATVTGSNNVSAVVQVGSTNVAAYSQNGTGNNVGILQ